MSGTACIDNRSPQRLSGVSVSCGQLGVPTPQVPAHRRAQVERLIRSTARGAVSLERLEQDAHGALVSTFTHPWSDGTPGMRRSPVDLVEKLAALVPLPRVHVVRSGGGLASHSHLRGALIPTPRQQGLDEEATDTGAPGGRGGRCG